MANEHIMDERKIEMAQKYFVMGIQLDIIADILNISTSTLNKYYREHMVIAQAEAVGRIGEIVYEKALDGDLQAAQFFLKPRGGWSETKHHEHTGAEGNPIDMNWKVEFGNADTQDK